MATLALVGNFGVDVVFGDTPRMTKTASGAGDCFLAVHSSTGNLVQVSVVGAASGDNCSCTGVASLGAGGNGKPLFAASCWYDGASVVVGRGQANATTIVNMKRNDLGDASSFVAAYDGAGDLQWAKGLGGGHSAYPVVTGTPNGVAVAGAFESSAQFAFGEAGATTLAAKDGAAYLAAYDRRGALAWVRQFGSGHHPVKVFQLGSGGGSLYVTASYAEAVTFGGGGAGAQTLPPVTGATASLALARYGTDGAFAWARRVGDAHAVRTAAAVGFPNGSAAIAGTFAGTIAIGVDAASPSTITSADASDDVFLARFDRMGQVSWVARAGGPGMDATPASPNPVLTAQGRLFLGGHVAGMASFGSGGAAISVGPPAADRTIVFVAEYAP